MGAAPRFARPPTARRVRKQPTKRKTHKLRAKSTKKNKTHKRMSALLLLLLLHGKPLGRFLLIMMYATRRPPAPTHTHTQGRKHTNTHTQSTDQYIITLTISIIRAVLETGICELNTPQRET